MTSVLKAVDADADAVGVDVSMPQTFFMAHT